jgi:patatin-like phospholipase/acyl hydrolase
MKSPIRILAVDGGGVGGILPARVLARLHASYPSLVERADLVAGTSTGGLIALGIARGLSPAQLCDLYLNQAKTIFSSTNRRYEVEWPIRAKYNPDGLREAVQTIVGDSTLGELIDKPVLVPVTAVDRSDGNHRPAGIFISTAYRLINDPTSEKYASSRWKCLDIALATAAAPTYFPAYRVVVPGDGPGREWNCWDGGIVANNPALAALGEVYRLELKEKNHTVRSELIQVPDVRVLSLGTGYRNILIDAGDWGLIQAARPVVRALLDTSVGTTAFLLRQVLGTRAVRVNVHLTEEYDMDDPGAVERLNEAALAYDLTAVEQPDKTLVNLETWLTEFWL